MQKTSHGKLIDFMFPSLLGHYLVVKLHMASCEYLAQTKVSFKTKYLAWKWRINTNSFFLIILSVFSFKLNDV